jgi:internalin A
MVVLSQVLVFLNPCRADDAEDKAVAFVEKLGGEVKRDEMLPGRPIIEVNLSHRQVMDLGLKELAPLKNLNTLYFFNTQVTDAGLKELAQFKSLTELELGCTAAISPMPSNWSGWSITR